MVFAVLLGKTESVGSTGEFLLFQNSDRHHLGFLNFPNFNSRNGQGGQTASPCKISWRSVKPLLRYGDFSIFPSQRMSAILDLQRTRQRRNDPFCCMTLLAIDWSLLQQRRYNAMHCHWGRPPNFGPPTKCIWRSLLLCKAWLEWYSTSFDNMQVFIFLRLRLENAYSRPQNWEFWEIWPTKWGAVSLPPPKGTSLRGNTSYDV